jgi:hypothetical protein
VEIALHSFFVSLPLAATLWMLMLLALAGAVAGLAVPRRRTPEPAPAGDDLRYAAEVSVAAERAAATAARHRAEWVSAQESLDTAWAAFDAADRAARQTTRAAAFPLMSRRRKPGENVDRQRYLHHAATAACRHRDLSIAQLNDVYAHRGWNPRLHPVAQEAVLRLAIREHRLAVYDAAQAQERTAWQAADAAAESLRQLRLEAAAAVAPSGVPQPVAGEQRRAEQWTTAELPVAA